MGKIFPRDHSDHPVAMVHNDEVTEAHGAEEAEDARQQRLVRNRVRRDVHIVGKVHKCSLLLRT